MNLHDPTTVSSPIQALEKFVTKLSRRSILSEEQRALLLCLPYEVVEVGTNRDFVRLGERVRHACLIADGLAGRFGQTRDGARQIAALHIPGDMADLHSVVAPEAATALQALTPSTIVRVPHGALKDAADRHPAIAEAFWRKCVIDGAIMAEWVLSLGRRNALSRTAHLLCELVCRHNVSAAPTLFDIPFPATQVHLGDALGLTSVHVNRTLRALREHGAATLRQRRIQVHDWSRLVALAEFDARYLQLGSDPRPIA